MGNRSYSIEYRIEDAGSSVLVRVPSLRVIRVIRCARERRSVIDYIGPIQVRGISSYLFAGRSWNKRREAPLTTARRLGRVWRWRGDVIRFIKTAVGVHCGEIVKLEVEGGIVIC